MLDWKKLHCRKKLTVIIIIQTEVVKGIWTFKWFLTFFPYRLSMLNWLLIRKNILKILMTFPLLEAKLFALCSHNCDFFVFFNSCRKKITSWKKCRCVYNAHYVEVVYNIWYFQSNKINIIDFCQSQQLTVKTSSKSIWNFR